MELEQYAPCWPVYLGLSAPSPSRVLEEEVLGMRATVLFTVLLLGFAFLSNPLGMAASAGLTILFTPFAYTVVIARRAAPDSGWVRTFWTFWLSLMAFIVFAV